MTMHPPSVKLWTDEDVLHAAQEIDALFSRPDWTSTYPGHGENGARYSVDFMCSKTMGDKIAPYLWKNRKRLGIWYVIWYGRIISETYASAGWRRYFAANDPNPSKSHKNHTHASFYPGRDYHPLIPVTPAVKGEHAVPTDRVIYLDKLNPGVRDSDSVFHLQTLLNKVNDKDILRTGNYDAATVASVKVFQEKMHDDIVDGDIGEFGLAALINLAGPAFKAFVVEEQS